MESFFILKVLVSFIAAGIWIGSVTLIAERLGSKRGGLIANLPSTVLIALVFVGLVNDAGFAALATRAVPVGMTIDTIFLMVFIILLKKSLVTAVLLSLSTWMVLAYTAGQIHCSSMVFTILVYFLVAITSFLILEYRFEIPSKGKSRKKFTPINSMVRALFAGSVVAGTTIISAFAGTYWVGLFSTFPAVMLSTMVILTLNQGKAFARATGKVMILASTNIIIYALGVSITYPLLGITLGTIISFVFSFFWVLLLHPLINKIIK